MNIVAIIVTVVFIFFTYCSCKVASWADDELEKELKEKKSGDKNE